MERVELTAIDDQAWADLRDGEANSFGAVGESLSWRSKDRYIALRGENGRLVAAAGTAIFAVEVEGAGTFDVVGLGGVIVTHTMRGRGLFRQVVEPVLEQAAERGPAHAMLFCRSELAPLYESLGFAPIEAPVWVDQPEGHVQIPFVAMWRPLRDGAEWPPGRVDVAGLPF